MRSLRFILGLFLLLVPEVLRVYYIMPFPGSQEDVASDLQQVNIAYWLHTYRWYFRLIGVAILIGPFWTYMRHGSWLKRIGASIPIALCAVVFYAFNFKFMADKMFLPMERKTMYPAAASNMDRSLAIVVVHNDQARAYPIQLIGYHHQIQDTIAGSAVLVTYCTVCRTGRVWKPIVNGKNELFRLVGMDHFNAMFEDHRTKSWWRQATGECIVGPLKGAKLEEVPSLQLTLSEFAARFPNGLVLQAEDQFAKQYDELKGYDTGMLISSLVGRDTASWQQKSWVIGVENNDAARAYDWNMLNRLRTIDDTLGGEPITLILSADNASFQAYHTTDTMRTTQQVLIPAYQEYWHSWRTFHPTTTRYLSNK